jgi:predicted nucleic acid-binding protein
VATPVRRIVNASPLILLAKGGQLDLLRAGVPEIIVPDAVLQEVSARGAADPVYQEILRTTWLKIAPALPTPPLGWLVNPALRTSVVCSTWPSYWPAS